MPSSLQTKCKVFSSVHYPRFCASSSRMRPNAKDNMSILRTSNAVNFVHCKFRVKLALSFQ